MSAITLLFPHQLFEVNPALQKDRPVWLIEESLFFTQYPFHIQKIVLHRASMKSYAYALEQQGYTIHYVEAKQKLGELRQFIRALAAKKVKAIHYVETVDYWIEERLQRTAASAGIELIRYGSPGFLNQLEEVTDYFEKRKTYFQTDFYIQQRKNRKWLVEKEKDPVGGKWTFDTDNRKPYPKDKKAPEPYPVKTHPFVSEAIAYAKKYFSENPGKSDQFCYPVTRAEALDQLDLFLSQRFN
ncbi:MAG: cryptochrome/photolyase family protein, partial [Sphingomonadales bacterium]